MNKEEAIKYLQQLCPNGGHCWLDEQIIEAIGMAVKALQEEPVSEKLEEAASRYAKEEYNRKNPATLPDRCKGCYAPLMYAFKAGAKWQKQQTITKACDWLKRNADSYTWYNEFDGESGMTEDFIDELKKAIQ